MSEGAEQDLRAASRSARQGAGTISAAERMVPVAHYIETHADEKLTLAQLAPLAGLSASRLQQAFKAAFGVSPKTYQDRFRMRTLKQGLQAGDKVTDAIYGAGFGSVSRVYGAAGRQLGMPPKTYRAGGAGEQVVYACRDTALGPLLMAATAKGVCFAEFGDDCEALGQQLQSEFPNAELAASPAQAAPELDAWMLALDRHLSERVPAPELPLDMRGTAFQIQVWQFLLQIPAGQVISYRELADRMGKPRAARAVASACARNRIGVLIPCHRVLRGDGGLGGYRWGLERKRQLLALEQAARDPG